METVLELFPHLAREGILKPWRVMESGGTLLPKRLG
jgi:hypothetical protein